MLTNNHKNLSAPLFVAMGVILFIALIFLYSSMKLSDPYRPPDIVVLPPSYNLRAACSKHWGLTRDLKILFSEENIYFPVLTANQIFNQEVKSRVLHYNAANINAVRVLVASAGISELYHSVLDIATMDKDKLRYISIARHPHSELPKLYAECVKIAIQGDDVTVFPLGDFDDVNYHIDINRDGVWSKNRQLRYFEDSGDQMINGWDLNACQDFLLGQ